MAVLQKWCLRIAALLGVILSGWLAFSAWRATAVMYVTADEKIQVIADSGVRHMLILVLLLACGGILWQLAGKCSRPVIQGIAGTISILIAAGLCVLIKAAHAYPIADQFMIYQGAADLLRGALEAENGDVYFRMYPYQLGGAGFYSLVLWAAGRIAPEAIQYFHALCAGSAFYGGFCVTGALFQDRRAELLYVFCMLPFFPFYLYVLFIYGETVGVCASVWAIWLFVRANRAGSARERAGCCIGVGMLLALVYLVRSALLIVWIAMLILQILHSLVSRKLWPVIAMACALVVMLGAQGLAVGLAERRLDRDFGGGMPVSLWFSMGLQEGLEEGRTPGCDNGYAWRVYEECGFDGEQAHRRAVEDLRARAAELRRSPGRIPVFIREKLAHQWLEPSYGAFAMTRFMDQPEKWVENLYYGGMQDTLYAALNQWQSFLYLLLLGYFVMLLTGKYDREVWLAGIIFIGGFLFSIVWEAKSRYVYPYLVFAMPCLAGALSYWLAWLCRLFQGGRIRRGRIGTEGELD